MITVRFPSGFSVQYNAATFVKGPAEGVNRLYTAENGVLIARIPADCIIEFKPPCRTYNACGTPEDIALEMLAMHKELRMLRLQLAKMKAKA